MGFKADDMPGRGGFRQERTQRAKMIALRLDADTLKAWDRAAVAMGLGRSEMIRLFVAEGLKDREVA